MPRLFLFQHKSPCRTRHSAIPDIFHSRFPLKLFDCIGRIVTILSVTVQSLAVRAFVPFGLQEDLQGLDLLTIAPRPQLRQRDGACAEILFFRRCR